MSDMDEALSISGRGSTGFAHASTSSRHMRCITMQQEEAEDE